MLGIAKKIFGTATVREAAKRTLGQRHYDVQLVGGITLHRGEIAEMRTGEGKTTEMSVKPPIIATLPTAQITSLALIICAII